MTVDSRFAIDVHLDESELVSTMAREVREGLAADPKNLPSKYFYDDRGSRLFEHITRLPEYYLTRAEHELLERRASWIARVARPRELLELGSGSAKKTQALIEAGLEAGTLRRYLPVDVSRQSAEGAARSVAARFPMLEIHAVIGDFERHLHRVAPAGRRLVALLGSTIGNFTGRGAVRLLSKVRALLGAGGWFLLGTDLVKERSVLEAAYNDEQGVTAEFNSNILNVINRHLDGDFETEQFEHVAIYNEDRARIESYLESRIDQTVHLGEIDLQVNFERGERVLTEVSCKYTKTSVGRLVRQAGMRLRHWIPDVEGRFALSLSRPDDGSIAVSA